MGQRVLMVFCMLSMVDIARAAPLQLYHPNLLQQGNNGIAVSNGYGQIVMLRDTRGFWDFLGNWIQSSSWFPIEVNIPDTFASIGNGFTAFANSIIQRIPFLNQSGQTRPLMVLVPFGMKQTPITRIAEISKHNMETLAEAMGDEALPYP